MPHGPPSPLAAARGSLGVARALGALGACRSRRSRDRQTTARRRTASEVRLTGGRAVTIVRAVAVVAPRPRLTLAERLDLPQGLGGLGVATRQLVRNMRLHVVDVFLLRL